MYFSSNATETLTNAGYKDSVIFMNTKLILIIVRVVEYRN